MPESILCPKCRQTKLPSDFPSDRRRPSGLHTYCRICRATEQRERNARYAAEKRALPTRCCYRCKVEKPASDFGSPGPRQRQHNLCAECREKAGHNKKEYRRNWHERVPEEERRSKAALAGIAAELAKMELINICGGCCEICGLKPSQDWPVCCFDFHHRDKELKLFTIGSKVRRFNLYKEELVEEVLKCVVLCANCHRKAHYRNWSKENGS